LIDKLTFLLALSREKHFGRAAEACGVTQPTLSAGIKQLETTLGVLLVYRSARYGGFTPEGERVLEWARRIVGDARAMHDEVKSLRQGLSGHLRLAVVPTALPVVTRLTTPMAERHPEVTFSVRSCNSLEVLALMENLEADAGITYVGSEPLGRVRSLSLYEESYRLLVTAQSPLGTKASVGWADVATVSLSLLTTDMQNRRIMDRRLHKAGADPVPVLETNSMIVLISHVRTGRWASVLPAIIADSLLNIGQAGGDGAPEIRSIPIREVDPLPVIGLVYPHREPLLPLTAALVTESRRVFTQERVFS
jgi:DNA-binding transcriptional LysR family regulator